MPSAKKQPIKKLQAQRRAKAWTRDSRCHSALSVASAGSHGASQTNGWREASEAKASRFDDSAGTAYSLASRCRRKGERERQAQKKKETAAREGSHRYLSAPHTRRVAAVKIAQQWNLSREIKMQRINLKISDNMSEAIERVKIRRRRKGFVSKSEIIESILRRDKEIRVELKNVLDSSPPPVK